MRWQLIAIVLCLFVGCTANTSPELHRPSDTGSLDSGAPDAGRSDASTPDGAADVDASLADTATADVAPIDAGDVGDDMDPIPTQMIAITLGPSESPYTPWAEGADVVIVEGPQGANHTEHSAAVTGAELQALNLALIWAEVWRDDLVLARAGWEFFEEQWEVADPGFSVVLPPLVFDGFPEPGPAELRASVELTDGRTADFALPIMLVAQ